MYFPSHVPVLLAQDGEEAGTNISFASELALYDMIAESQKRWPGADPRAFVGDLAQGSG